MSAVEQRDDLLRQQVQVRESMNAAVAKQRELRGAIQQAERDQEHAYQDAARGKGPHPAAVAEDLRKLRDELAVADQTVEGAERARRTVELELTALYRFEPEAFAEEAEAATQAFCARRDEVIGELRERVAELVALERAGRSLWTPLCQALGVEGPRPSVAWSVQGQLGELASVVPRPRPFIPDMEEAA